MLGELRQGALEGIMVDAIAQAATVPRDEVRIFSRRLNVVTIAVPEIVDAIRSFPARTLILDGETLAIKPNGTPHSFQTTMRRFGRKLDIAALRHELPLKTFYFDCLHVDGEDLIDQTGAERAAVMQRILPPDFLMSRIVTDQSAAAEQFMTEALHC